MDDQSNPGGSIVALSEATDLDSTSDSPSGANPFNNLPEELILHIIRAGADDFADELREEHFSPPSGDEMNANPAILDDILALNYGGSVNRRGKPFTRLVTQICSRFRKATLPAQWNTELFYVLVSVNINQFTPVPDRHKDICNQLAQGSHALASSKGCDILVSFSYFHYHHYRNPDLTLRSQNDAALATNLAVYGVNMLHEYRKQAAWFKGAIICQEMVDWLMVVAGWFLRLKG
jgi:hypothetical protein